MTQQLPLRKELPIEETWDLSLLFADQSLYEEEVASLRSAILQFRDAYQGQLNTVTNIEQALEAYDSIRQRLSPVYNYANLGYQVDKYNTTYEENIQKFSYFYDWMRSQLNFFDSELSAVAPEIMTQVRQGAVGQKYIAFLDAMEREKAILQSPEVEQALSHLQGALSSHSDLYEAMKFQDMVFEPFTVDGTSYPNSFAGFEGEYETHPNAAIRQASWDSFHQGLRQFENTAATNYIKHVQAEKKMATVRGFDSVIDYLLFNQQVDRDNYNRIIDTLMTELAPVMRRYATMLKEEAQLETISLADIKMPFTQGDIPKITIAESEKMIRDAFQVLGEEYLAIVERAFDQRWIDYPMNQTKSTGGFCSSVYPEPGYVLLNWTGLMSEVLVLAHELGHVGHFVMQYHQQPALSPSPSLYFIEAPSTANEVMMCQYLLNQDMDAAAKRSLISEFIARTYFHNMVTHLLEAHFQRKVYTAVDEEQVLNAKVLNRFFRESLEEFWGDAVEINEGSELTWMRQPHYFMGLYSYTYSAGLTVGTQIGLRIAQGDQAAINQWIEVLKAGGTHSPLELAQMADVDMSNDTALRSAIAYVNELLDQIDALK